MFEFIVFVALASKNHLLTILGAPFFSCLEANKGGRKTSVSEHNAIAAQGRETDELRVRDWREE